MCNEQTNDPGPFAGDKQAECPAAVVSGWKSTLRYDINTHIGWLHEDLIKLGDVEVLDYYHTFIRMFVFKSESPDTAARLD